MSENSLPESLTASSRGTSGLPVEGILLEQSFADVVGGGETGHRVYRQLLYQSLDKILIVIEAPQHFSMQFQ